MINIESMLLELYEADTEKYFDDPAKITMFDKPIVGVADPQDPWFLRFKELIGDFYWTPQEALSQIASEVKARSVISWYLPISKVARKANYKETLLPSRTWAYVRTFGDRFMVRLAHEMEKRLRSMGFAALAPGISPPNQYKDHPVIGLSSLWSERHTAMVAGLGTFGLSGGLITKSGVAHRLGSIVTDAQITPNTRPYGNDAFAWCLKLSRGTCGACIKRCPAGSIGLTIQARDKNACLKHSSDVIKQRCSELFGWEGVYGCGLCQTAVPCENRNPTASSEEGK